MKNSNVKRDWLMGGLKTAERITEERVIDPEFISRCRNGLLLAIEEKKTSKISPIIESMYWYVPTQKELVQLCRTLFLSNNHAEKVDKFISLYESNYATGFVTEF